MAKPYLHKPTFPFRGLWLAGGKEAPPQGALRRASGIHRVYTGSIRSRVGSSLVAALTAHSLYRFNDARYAGATTIFYRDGSSIKTGLSGDRLAFVRMPPQYDKADSLFVAGGGDLFKEDGSGNTSSWGIAAPTTNPTAAVGTQASQSIDALDAQCTWTGSDATLADESTILQEGCNSMKMTVSSRTIGQATKAITVDLSTFSCCETSSDEDLIAVWVRVDNPANLEYLQIDFDINGTAFSESYYSRVIKASERIPVATQTITQSVGIGTITGRIEDETLYVKQQHPSAGQFVYDPDKGHYVNVPADAVTYAPTTLSKEVVESLGQVTITTAVGAWTRLRIPKKAFSKHGSSANTWANVQAVRLTAKTNTKGSVVVYWDDLKMIGGAGLLGDYRYYVTFKNSTTGSRSNPNPTPTLVQNVERQGVTLSSVPTSADSQVDTREIWRTVGNGALYFKVGEIADNTTTTFTDTVADYAGLWSVSGADVLQDELLEFDNAPPDDDWDDCAGPHNGAMFWCRSQNAGEKGRVYYSPIGRPESQRGFIQITDDDDPTQKLVVWNGLWCFTEGGIYQILGTDPYSYRQVRGAPGTTKPHTVQATPFGILYEADDGVRVFNGAVSNPAAAEAIQPLFQGEAIENLAAFSGVCSGFGRGEYYIGDGVAGLALNLRTGTWRELGLAANAFYYEPDTQELQLSAGGTIYLFEDEGNTDDNGTGIDFEVEWPSLRIDPSTEGVLQRIYLDINTNDATLTPTVIVDGVAVTLPLIQTSARATVELPQVRPGALVGLRLAGTVTVAVEIFSVMLDVYTPQVVQA